MSTPQRWEAEVSLPAAGTHGVLTGDLALPRDARGLVVFAHGSGSSRYSPRNRWVAEQLRGARIGTLLMDLLTADEERADLETGHLRFDIDLLVRRVLGAVDWLIEQDTTRELALGLFGASTGAAAALGAAAQRPDVIRAVVSRGGRPDLASGWLAHVRAPTLLLVGGRDEEVLELNQQAARSMSAAHEVRVVEGASHLFPEPGALEQVASAAAGWFGRFLVTGQVWP